MSNPLSARMAVGLAVCLIVGLALVLFVAMLVLTAPLVPALPAIQLTFNREAFDAVLAAWVAQGEAWRFAWHFWLDVPFVLAYAWAGWCWRERQPLAGLLLVGAALADLLEDALHLWFLGWSGSAPEGFYLVAGWAAMVKFKLWAVAGLVAGVRWWRRRQRDV
ncbi:MAG: hypothetical protein RJB26_1468 [Pseudomonadota bacterium]